MSKRRMSKRRTSQRKKLSRKKVGGLGVPKLWKTGECGWSQHISNPRAYTWYPCAKEKKCRFRDDHKSFHWPQGQNFGPGLTSEKGSNGIRPSTNQQPWYRVVHKNEKTNLGKCF